MSETLRQALRDEAERAGSYAVYDRTLRTARRRRRRRLASVAAGIAAVLVLLLAGLPGALAHRAFTPAGPPADAPSLPDRLGFPPAFHPGIRDSPPGPASVVFGGQGFPISTIAQLLDGEGDLAVVGARSEIYRTWLVSGFEVHAGEDVLLSPDGARLAMPSSMRTGVASVVDLRTGAAARLGAFEPTADVTPLAWSPEGERLAVQVSADGQDWIALVNVSNGRWQRLGDVDRSGLVGGFNLAFAPDGRRLAYQVGDRLTVMDLDRDEQIVRTVPADVRLAGKGAWTPDGTTLMMVRRDPNRSWQLVAQDPVSGVTREVGWTGGTDLTALRLIGWGPDGDPVVVAFRVEPSVPPEVRDRATPETAYQVVHSIKVLSLPRVGAPRTLLTAPHNLMSIDVADQVIAGGRVRPGNPPRYGPLTGVSALLVLGAATLAVHLFRRRRWRAAAR